MSDGWENVDEQRKFELTDEYKKLRGAFQTCFGSPEGEHALDHLREFCCWSRSAFVPGDPHHTSFLEGRRDVFLEIETLRSLDDRKIEKLVKRKMKGQQTYE
jgi:hypothetical protein